MGGNTLFYDRLCSKKAVGGMFMIKTNKEPNEHVSESLTGDCSSAAYLIYAKKREVSDMAQVYNVVTPPEGVPPHRHNWRVWCGTKHGHMVMPVTIDGGSQRRHVTAKGSWKFLHTAMPGEHVTMETGMTTTTEDESTASLGAEVSLTMGGEVGLSVFGPKASTEASASASTSYERVWKQSASKTTKNVRKFKLPDKGGYHALFQFKFDIEDDSGRKGTSLTDEFAFTPTGAMPPKCVPGGCAPDDCPHYQTCVDGYYM